MLGISLGFASSICWGISDLLGGMMARRVSAIVVLYASQAVGFALALGAVLFLAGDGLPADEAAWAAGAGGIAALALGAFYRALAIGPISVVVTLSAMGVMVPVAVGLARGESPDAIQGVGVALAITGGMLVARGPAGDWPHASRTTMLLALGASLGFGTFFVGIDAAADSDPAWAVAAARAGGVGALILLWPLLRPDLRLARPIAGPVAAIGAFDVGANAFFAVATTHGLLALIAPAASLYSAVTVVLARVVLGERVPPSRVVAIAIAMAGVVLIASGT